MTPASHRHNVWIQPDLWKAAERAALQESVRRGRAVSVAEWIREAMEAKLAASEDHQRPE